MLVRLPLLLGRVLREALLSSATSRASSSVEVMDHERTR